MSAPPHAITVQEEADTEWLDSKDKYILRSGVSCVCGWVGVLGDLLCDSIEPNPPPNDFWCPVCETRGWSFC